MGLIVAIAVGIISLLIGFSAGGPVAGMLFGAIMFAMTYGAFVWRPGEKKNSIHSASHDREPDAKISEPAGRNQMLPEAPALKQAVLNSFAIPLTQIGLDDKIALETAEKIVAEVLAEFRPRGIDPFKITQGDEYVRKQDFTTPRIAAGLTLEDIRKHWNRPLIIGMGEFKMREMLNFIFIDIARMQGRDLVEADREYKKTFPRYGDPRNFDPTEKFNQELRPVDADIFPEFAGRVEAWRQRAGEAAVAQAIKAHGTLNAAVRALVSAGQL